MSISLSLFLSAILSNKLKRAGERDYSIAAAMNAR